MTKCLSCAISFNTTRHYSIDCWVKLNKHSPLSKMLQGGWVTLWAQVHLTPKYTFHFNEVTTVRKNWTPFWFVLVNWISKKFPQGWQELKYSKPLISFVFCFFFVFLLHNVISCSPVPWGISIPSNPRREVVDTEEHSSEVNVQI